MSHCDTLVSYENVTNVTFPKICDIFSYLKNVTDFPYLASYENVTNDTLFSYKNTILATIGVTL